MSRSSVQLFGYATLVFVTSALVLPAKRGVARLIATPHHQVIRKFAALLRQHLKPNGIYLTNVLDSFAKRPSPVGRGPTYRG